MSTNDLDDLETTGYFLPEDSQLRLKKLRAYVEFLSHLAQPRIAGEDQEFFPEIRPGEVAICLGLLEEQIGQVLEEISWPAERGEREAVPETDAEAECDAEPEGLAAAEAVTTDNAEPERAGPARSEAPKRYVAGVTLEQIDKINLLLESLHAIGNVVACTDQAEFSDATLSIMGDAIYRDVDALRDIIRDLDSMQRLDDSHGTKPGVREEHASYLALPLHVPMDKTSSMVQQLPTYH